MIEVEVLGGRREGCDYSSPERKVLHSAQEPQADVINRGSAAKNPALL